MTRSKRSTVRRIAASVTIVLATLAAMLSPVTPAHAAYGPDQPVYIAVTSNAGPPLLLAQLTGTVAFDDGNTKFKYSLQLCWGSGSYPKPNFYVSVNGSTVIYPSQTGTATAPPGCQLYLYLHDGEYTHYTTVTNITVYVTGGWFYPGQTYNSRTKSVTYDNPYN
ncbi:unnamed protein product [[Actinomadura] parvosata subsp. kistnae]|uniref:Uncharacterized protein n=1 Tax=[Actinomadura] parvosata subsp. kistnae TaxID=1909395 RepID=A0A1V0ABY7_9ACTN|nr:hypothetical protein [Nonomuraea sp. ATCC 55076]AQZ67750.1 hypothetical protein BKM31_45410 [Nonomuraea sp. ATCC 55076]SPL93950.1 unnamed protein product [Actinomadura parvosata subsp. kistnae]